MTSKALITALQSQSERDLLGLVLVPLFTALGYERVSLEVGPHEFGRDLVCWGRDELGEQRIVVVQVKRFRPDGNINSKHSLRMLLHQIEQAFEASLILPDGTSRFPTAAIIITPYPLSQMVLSTVSRSLQELHRRRISIVDGSRLAELVSQRLPELAGRLSGSDSGNRGEIPINGPAASSWDSSGQLLDFLAALRADIDRRIGPFEPIDPKLCFVIMSFSTSPILADFYEKAIKPTIEQLGFRCERIDEQQFNDRITERLFLNLRTARFVVAELTEARPNCYYELGVAHALGKEVVHLIYSSSKDIHFDVKDWNFIIYSRLDELKSVLRERILGTVGPADLESGDG